MTSFRIVLCAVCVGWALTHSADSQAQVLTASPVAGPTGSIVTGETRIAPTFDVTGWSYSVCPDLAVASMVDAVAASGMSTINDGMPPDFQSIEIFTNQVKHSVTICAGACGVLPTGSDLAMLEIDYALFGADGDVGSVCICEGTPPDLVFVVDDGGNPVSQQLECATIAIGPCSSGVANRGIESFEILPRAGQPGRFDLRLNWAVETAEDFQALDTRTVFEVSGTTVGTGLQQIEIFDLSCCDSDCSSAPCGTWVADGVAESGECEASVEQGVCMCRLRRTSLALDIEIPEGAQVTARLLATLGSEPEVIVDDNEVTRLAPYFNRELVRVAWLPVAGTPSTYTAWVFTRIEASPVDAPVDFGYVATIDPQAGGQGGMTEVEIKIPNGVDPCLLEPCKEDCFLPNSNPGPNQPPNGSCEIEPLCATCAAADIVELDLLVATPGEPIEVSIATSFEALAEANPGDDSFVILFDGPIAAPNRQLLAPSTFATVTGPNLVDLNVSWLAETGARSWEDLSVEFIVSVNGEEVGTFDSVEVFGKGTSCAAGLSCGTATGDQWQVDGALVSSNCRQSPTQQVCVAALEFVQVISDVPAGPGDVIVIELVRATDAMPELFDDQDMLTLTVPSSPGFVRGDVDGGGSIDLADAVSVLSFLFSAGSLVCRDAADFGDDGMIDIADPVGLLSFLFQSAAAPQPPFPNCGVDPTADLLDCAQFSGCP